MRHVYLWSLIVLAACAYDTDPTGVDVQEQAVVQNPIVPWSTPIGYANSELNGFVNTQSPEYRGTWANTPGNTQHYDLEFFTQGPINNPIPGAQQICAHIKRVNECNFVMVCWRTQTGKMQFIRKLNAGMSTYSQCFDNGLVEFAQMVNAPTLMYSNQWAHHLYVDWTGTQLLAHTDNWSIVVVPLPAELQGLVGASGAQTKNGVFRFRMNTL